MSTLLTSFSESARANSPTAQLASRSDEERTSQKPESSVEPEYTHLPADIAALRAALIPFPKAIGRGRGRGSGRARTVVRDRGRSKKSPISHSHARPMVASQVPTPNPPSKSLKLQWQAPLTSSISDHVASEKIYPSVIFARDRHSPHQHIAQPVATNMKCDQPVTFQFEYCAQENTQNSVGEVQEANWSEKGCASEQADSPQVESEPVERRGVRERGSSGRERENVQERNNFDVHCDGVEIRAYVHPHNPPSEQPVPKNIKCNEPVVMPDLVILTTPTFTPTTPANPVTLSSNIYNKSPQDPVSKDFRWETPIMASPSPAGHSASSENTENSSVPLNLQSKPVSMSNDLRWETPIVAPLSSADHSTSLGNDAECLNDLRRKPVSKNLRWEAPIVVPSYPPDHSTSSENDVERPSDPLNLRWKTACNDHRWESPVIAHLPTAVHSTSLETDVGILPAPLNLRWEPVIAPLSIHQATYESLEIQRWNNPIETRKPNIPPPSLPIIPQWQPYYAGC
ncbi:hypothetical protein BDQ17DRAFT_1344692 [Cyathus striatus]|nr:hypothetical protein BDQ17DRAFT_1344692 [Cyathus striatus]